MQSEAKPMQTPSEAKPMLKKKQERKVNAFNEPREAAGPTTSHSTILADQQHMTSAAY